MNQVVCRFGLLLCVFVSSDAQGQVTAFPTTAPSSTIAAQSAEEEFLRSRTSLGKDRSIELPGNSRGGETVVSSLPPIPSQWPSQDAVLASSQRPSAGVTSNPVVQASGTSGGRTKPEPKTSETAPSQIIGMRMTKALAASHSYPQPEQSSPSDAVLGDAVLGKPALGNPTLGTPSQMPSPLGEPWYELGQYGLLDSNSVVTSVAPAIDIPEAARAADVGLIAETSFTSVAQGAEPAVEVGQRSKKVAHKVKRRKQSAILNFFRRRSGYDKGLGHERVMFAPFVLDTATSLPNSSVTLAASHGLGTPDRLEYFWASPQIGPAAESRVDVLDTVIRTEIGNRKAMALASYTMRSLNPERNDNTTGFGDMMVGAKALIVDGKCTQIASIFQTYLKTGPADRGLGTGHMSLEPGVLFRQQLSEMTFFHAEAKYWIPIAGRAGFAGDVLRLGAGVSTIWRESDSHALMPTLEFVTYNFLAGSKTDASGNTVRVNGNFAAEVLPGLRCAFGESALGMHEFGVSAGAKLADRDWFDTRLLLQMRLVR